MQMENLYLISLAEPPPWPAATRCRRKSSTTEAKTKRRRMRKIFGRNCFEFDANTHEVVAPATDTNPSKTIEKIEFTKGNLHFAFDESAARNTKRCRSMHARLVRPAMCAGPFHSTFNETKWRATRAHLWTNADIVCMRETCKWRNPNRLSSAWMWTL